MTRDLIYENLAQSGKLWVRWAAGSGEIPRLETGYYWSGDRSMGDKTLVVPEPPMTRLT